MEHKMESGFVSFHLKNGCGNIRKCAKLPEGPLCLPLERWSLGEPSSDSSSQDRV